MDNSKIPPEEFEIAEQAIIDGNVPQLEYFLNKYKDQPRIRQWYGSVGPYSIKEKYFREDAKKSFPTSKHSMIGPHSKNTEKN